MANTGRGSFPNHGGWLKKKIRGLGALVKAPLWANEDTALNTTWNAWFWPQTTPTTSLNTPVDVSSTSDTTPTFDFTGTDLNGDDIRYQLQIDTVNTFDSLDQYSDIYAFGNNNTSSVLDITGAAAGQSFAGNGLVLKSATVQLHKNNSPTGNIYAKIYAHTGTFGTSSVPTGTALATSDAFGAATVPGSQSNITFTFSGANKITLENGTYYCLSIEYDGDATNNISLYYDNASPTHPGNNFYYFGGWNAQSAHDVGFVVNTERPLINKVSSLNTGFVNPDVGGDTDPFVSGDNIQYTIQSSEDILTNAQDSEGSSFGFGEFANVRYRGQRFTPLISGEITTVGFSRNKGSQGIKVYFDTVTSNAPTNSPGSELYSFTITNANVIDEYGEYALPTPLAVTGGTEYCFYIAPWDTSGNVYADDYQDVRGVSVTGGGEITNTTGTWSMENLTFHYRIYVTVDDTLAVDTYYWRVRGLDPSGTNEYGAWSSTRSFDVTSGSNITINASVLSILANFISPTRIVEKLPTVNTATATTQTPVPSVTKLPSVLTSTATTQAPTLNISATHNATVLAINATVQTPTKSVTQSPSVLSSTGTAQAPTPTVTQSPSVIVANATLLSPSLQISSTYTAPVLTATAGVSTPVHQVLLQPSVLTTTTTFQSPSFSVSKLPTALSVTGSVQDPVKTIFKQLSELSTTAALITPTVGVGTDITVFAPVLTATATFNTPDKSITKDIAVILTNAAVQDPTKLVTKEIAGLVASAIVNLPTATAVQDVTINAPVLTAIASIHAGVVTISGPSIDDVIVYDSVVVEASSTENDIDGDIIYDDAVPTDSSSSNSIADTIVYDEGTDWGGGAIT